MDAITLIRALEACELEPRSYSGRGSNNFSCVGVVLRDITEFTLGAMLVAALPDYAEDFTNLRVCSDSMGLDTIVYFPGVLWP